MVRGGPRSSPRAQASIEYVLIMAFALTIILPLIVLYYTQTSRISEETTSAAIERAATQIAESADTVYYLGAPSTRTTVVDLPENVRTATFVGQSIVFTVASSSGVYDQVGWSVANLTGTMGTFEGTHVLTITSLSDGTVSITEG